MSYKNATLYYWSGTGNSYRVSTWLGEIAEKEGIDSEVISIDKADPIKDIQNGGENLLAISFPTHGFTAPWHLIKFVCKLPRRKSTHAICIATRAGLKFGSLFVPGISASATFLIGFILILKGYSIRGLKGVDMPSNWFSLHPIQSRRTHEAIINRNKQKVSLFIDKIYSGKRVIYTPSSFIEMVWMILLSWISIGYLLMGRFGLAKLFFSNNNCDGCGVCAKSCSCQAIKMWGKNNPKPYWKYNCESCMRCAAFCPHNAIEAGHSWGIMIYLVTSLPVSVWFLTWLGSYFPSISNINGNWIYDILDLLYFYPAIFLSYLIFYWLLRIPVVNWLFTHTTFTNYWGRYRESNTKLKNVSQRKKASK